MFDRDRTGPNEGPPPLDRWTVDLADGKVRESRFDDRAQEFPRIDERLVGKRHRYGCTPTVLEGVEGDDTLLKHDFVRNCTESRSFGSGKALGEFVFHPSSPDAVEDDGVLMGFVYDRLTDRSELAIIDAQTLHASRPSSCRIEYPPDFTATGSRALTRSGFRNDRCPLWIADIGVRTRMDEGADDVSSSPSSPR
jgi:carotenoid cleavage dioxygenase-like enzyme